MAVASGVLVGSVEQAIAAPFATRLAADHRARVVRKSRGKAGDFTREYDSSVLGTPSYFVWLNRSKESLTPNIASDEGWTVLRKLLPPADILVQNLAPGSTSRPSVDYNPSSAGHPGR